MRMLFAFNLNRTMPDVVMRQFMFDAVGNLFRLCNRHVAIDNNMAGQNVDIAGNRPNMQVVNGFYAFRIADNAEQLIGMNVFRAPSIKMCKVCLNSFQPLRPTKAATSTLATVSAHCQPYAIISTAATIAPIEPNKSLIHADTRRAY